MKRKNRTKNKKRFLLKTRPVLKSRFVWDSMSENFGIVDYYDDEIFIYDRSKKRYLRGSWEKEHAKSLVNALNKKSGKHLRSKIKYETPQPKVRFF